MRPRSASDEHGTAESYLPIELRRVLKLAPELRICFVLRILVGLPAQVCAQILHLGIRRINQYSLTAIKSLGTTELSGRARLTKRFNEIPAVGGSRWTNCDSKGEQNIMDHPDDREVEHLAYRLWQERGSPIGSPSEDWFRAESELRRERSFADLRISSLAMGPTER